MALPFSLSLALSISLSLSFSLSLSLPPSFSPSLALSHTLSLLQSSVFMPFSEMILKTASPEFRAQNEWLKWSLIAPGIGKP